MTRLPVTPLILSLLVAATPAFAQRGWGDGWPRGGDDRVATQGNAEPSRQIDVETFRAGDAGDRLGKGRIVVSAAPAPPREVQAREVPMLGTELNPAPDDKLPVYEAAVIDQLAGKGYDIANAADPAQLVEIAVSHDIVVPEEAPHKPVSGAASVGVSNRGSGFALAIAVDLSKPRKAIVATRIDVRIRDRASHRVLWEGYAQGQSRMTDSGYDDTPLANRLAKALFARFPEGRVVQAVPGVDPLGPPQGSGE